MPPACRGAHGRGAEQKPHHGPVTPRRFHFCQSRTSYKKPQGRTGGFQALVSGESNERSALKVTSPNIKAVLSRVSPPLSPEGFAPLRNTTHQHHATQHPHQRQEMASSSAHRLLPAPPAPHNHIWLPLLCNKTLDVTLLQLDRHHNPRKTPRG